MELIRDQPWPVRLRWFRDTIRRESRAEFAAALTKVATDAGENVMCDARRVARWEDGEVSCPRPVYLRLLAKLGAPLPPSVAAARTVGGGVEVTEDEEVLRRNFLSAVASAVVGVTSGLDRWLPELVPGVGTLPSKAGSADVARLRAITDDLGEQQNRYGGSATVDATCAALGWSAGLLRADCSDSTRNELLLALTDLANIAGWACHDSGQQTLAQRYLSRALMWAKAVEAPEADSRAADVLFGMGRVALHQRQPKDALRLAQLGQIAAQDAGDLGESAQLHATAAWAYGLMGQRQRVEDSLARAQHEMSRINLDQLEPWHKVFFTAGDFAGHRALVNGVLAAALDDQTAAVELAEESVALTRSSLSAADADRPARSLLYDRIVLSTALFRVGEVDSGVREATVVLEQMQTIRSGRAMERLAEIEAAATPFAASYADVRDLTHELVLARAS
ncbi:hypothetical protein ACWEO2_17785 [Nocardia sp. NPDC004278]